MSSDDPRVPTDASEVATMIVQRSNSDITFVPNLIGESRHILEGHFITMIETALQREGIVYGDHPLLRPFIELHARELTDFVTTGVALAHQFRIPDLGHFETDSGALLRVDIWDSFSRLITDAEGAFHKSGGGLKALLEKIETSGTQMESPARA